MLIYCTRVVKISKKLLKHRRIGCGSDYQEMDQLSKKSCTVVLKCQLKIVRKEVIHSTGHGVGKQSLNDLEIFPNT